MDQRIHEAYNILCKTHDKPVQSVRLARDINIAVLVIFHVSVCRCVSLVPNKLYCIQIRRQIGLKWGFCISCYFSTYCHRRLYVSLLTVPCTTRIFLATPCNSKQGPLSLQRYNKVEDISPQHKLQLGKHL